MANSTLIFFLTLRRIQHDNSDVKDDDDDRRRICNRNLFASAFTVPLNVINGRKKKKEGDGPSREEEEKARPDGTRRRVH